jgi:hypothetical protein
MTREEPVFSSVTSRLEEHIDDLRASRIISKGIDVLRFQFSIGPIPGSPQSVVGGSEWQQQPDRDQRD